MPTADFLAHKTDDQIQAQWWVDIEGLRVRYGTVNPSWGPADTGTNRPIKAWMTDWPMIQAHSVEPLDGSSEPYKFDIEIMDGDDSAAYTDYLTALFANFTTTAAREDLMAALTASATSVEVRASGSFAQDTDVYIDRETMRVTAIPDGTHLTVTRGMYGSKAVAHLLTDAQNNTRTAQVMSVPPFIIGRRMILYENRSGLVEADAIRFYGYIDKLNEKEGVWRIAASGMLSKLSKSLGAEAPTTKLKYALWDGENWKHLNLGYFGEVGGEGHKDIGDAMGSAVTTWCIYAYDTTKFPASATVRIGDEIIHYDAKKAGSSKILELDSSFEGIPAADAARDWMYKHATLKGRGMFANDIFGAYGMASGDQKHVGVIRDPMGSVTSVYGDLRLVTQHDPDTEVRLVVTHEDFTAGVDPISIALQILQSSGTTDANGAYDHLPATFGCDIDEADIDVAGFEAMREKYCADLDLHFCITEPVEAKKWLEENVLRPSLLFLRETPDGKIGIGRIMTSQEVDADSTVVTVTTDDFAEIPELEASDNPIGEFEWAVNFDPGSKEYRGKIRVVMGNTGEWFGSRARKFKLECSTCYDYRVTGNDATAIGGQQLGMCSMLADYINTVWDRFANVPLPKLVLKMSYARLADIEVGDAIKVTCAGVSNMRTGARGFTAEAFQVVSILPTPESSQAEFRLWQVGVNNANYRAIAPSAKVAAYSVEPGGFGKVTLTTGVFESSGDAAECFVAGDNVILVNSKYEPLAGATAEVIAILTVGSNFLIFDGEPTTPPGAGDFVTTAKYDDQVAAQKAAWASLADSSGKLGSGDADGHVRQ